MANPKPLINSMTSKRSQEIIQGLIQGVDPNGEEIPKDSVLNRIEVVRALLTANAALTLTQVRDARRALLPSNVGRPWTQEEEATLAEARKENMPVKDIAAMHGRTIRSIEARLVGLGLMRNSERTTGDTTFSKKAKHK